MEYAQNVFKIKIEFRKLDKTVNAKMGIFNKITIKFVKNALYNVKAVYLL